MTTNETDWTADARRRLALFLGVLTVLVVAFTLVAWSTDVHLLAFGPAYMFTPFVAAIVVCYRFDVPLRDVGLRLGRHRWLLVAALAWPVMALGITGLALLVPGVSFDPSIVRAATGVPDGRIWFVAGLTGLIAVMVLAGVTVNAVVAFGEEFGWRGYLLWELAPLGFWKASAVIGTIWGLWHAPFVAAGLNYPSFPLVGVLLFTVVCIAVSPLFTYLVVRGESVFPAVLFHGVFNATGLVALAGTDDPVLRELVASEGGLVGLVVFGIVLLVIRRAGAPVVAGGGSPGSVDDVAVDPSRTAMAGGD